MKAHWRYFKYVLRHKWFVLLAGISLGASWWRLLVHDLSKFRPSEWFPYVQYFYSGGGNDKARDFKFFPNKDFDLAWLYHQRRNLHHWQAWILREDEGEVKVLPMPEKYILEMVADWAGAGRAITGKWGVSEWYKQNWTKMNLAPETRRRVEVLIAWWEKKRC